MPRSASEVGIEVEGRTSGTTEVCRTAHRWRSSQAETSSSLQPTFVRKNDATRATAGSW
jgi:hypothetical protein